MKDLVAEIATLQETIKQRKENARQLAAALEEKGVDVKTLFQALEQAQQQQAAVGSPAMPPSPAPPAPPAPVQAPAPPPAPGQAPVPQAVELEEETQAGSRTNVVDRPKEEEVAESRRGNESQRRRSSTSQSYDIPEEDEERKENIYRKQRSGTLLSEGEAQEEVVSTGTIAKGFVGFLAICGGAAAIATILITAPALTATAIAFIAGGAASCIVGGGMAASAAATAYKATHPDNRREESDSEFEIKAENEPSVIRSQPSVRDHSPSVSGSWADRSREGSIVPNDVGRGGNSF